MLHPCKRLAFLALALGILAAAQAQEAKPVVPEKVDPPSAEGQRVSLPFLKEVPISVILGEIQNQTGIKIAPYGKAGSGKAALAGENMTVEEALTRLAQPNNMVWRKTPAGYELWDKESYEKELLPKLREQKVFVPVHISGEYLFEAIKQSNILTKDIGNITLDKRTNQVVVSDLPQKLALIQDMVNLLDVPQYTRVFYIRYADIEEVAKKIEQFKSEPGTIEVDPLAHLIIVRDVLANIQRMESLIEVLDIRQPRRVYNLNSVGIEEDEIKALEENLKLLVTQDAYYYIDPMRGQLILEDTLEVHEDVEKFLRVFDQPIKQVLIQAELLDVKQTDSLNFGTEMSFSGNLDWAIRDGLLDNFTDSGSGQAGSRFGFIDYREEFPLGTSGAGGLTVKFLTRNVKAQLTAALTDTHTRTLLKPRLLVKNREKATVHSGAQNPIVNQTTQYSNTTTGNYNYSQQYVSSGLTVEIEPTISATDLIEISLSIENSDADTVSLQAGIDANGNPVSLTGVKKVEDTVSTVLIIPNGETRVISGILTRGATESKSGVPFLVNIPWIGPLLFGKQENSDDTRNLLFFITPTIVHETGSGELIAVDFDEFERPMSNQPLSGIFGTQREESTADTLTDTAPEGAMQPEPALGRRFDAPLPERSKAPTGQAIAPMPETSTEAAAPRDNSVEGLRRFLQEGGGQVPEALQVPAPESNE